jgi:hypothetical protein
MAPTEQQREVAAEEPVARVSRRGFAIAFALTVVVLTLLALGGFGPNSSEPSGPAVTESPLTLPDRDVLFDEGQAAPADLTEGTCAHRTVAFETVVRVTNTTSGASTTCMVTRRGPYVAGRIIELERSVFDEIAPANAREITVRVEW